MCYMLKTLPEACQTQRWMLGEIEKAGHKGEGECWKREKKTREKRRDILLSCAAGLSENTEPLNRSHLGLAPSVSPHGEGLDTAS